MLTFGYVVSDVHYKDLKDDVLQIVKDESECSIADIPKLIIGLDKAKDYAQRNGYDFDILEHVFPNGDMWTFKKTEKRAYYEKNMQEFKQYIIQEIAKHIHYYYINVYGLRLTKLKDLYHIIFDNFLQRRTNYFVIDGEMLYLALTKEKVIGISFNHLKYIGIQREKIIGKIRQKPYNKVYFTTSKNMWQLKKWFEGIEYNIAAIFFKNAKN